MEWDQSSSKTLYKSGRFGRCFRSKMHKQCTCEITCAKEMNKVFSPGLCHGMPRSCLFTAGFHLKM